MKTAKSKFAKKPFKYQKGGFLSQSSMKGIGAGFDVLGNAFGARSNSTIDFEDGNPWANVAANNYNKTLAKNQATKKQISGGLSAAGDLAMLVPGIGTAVGLGLKGLGMAANFIPFGQGAERRAKRDYESARLTGQTINNATEGALSYNKMPKYQAPAYGKKGMKFKTKYSKK